MRGTIDYDGGKMKGVSNAVIGPLLGPDGKPLRDDQERDSEGATLIDGGPAGGTAYISFERYHRILRIRLARKSSDPHRQEWKSPGLAHWGTCLRTIFAQAP